MKDPNLKKQVLALYQATQTNNLALYKPYPKQETFHSMGASKPFRMFLAGNRTGKTYAGAAEMAMHLTGRYPAVWNGLRFSRPIEGWAATVTFGSPMKSLLKLYMGGVDPEDYGKGAIPRDCIKKVKNNPHANDALDWVRIKHVTGGTSVLYFKGYHQGRETFQSDKIDFIHLDEEPDLGIFSECAMRLAGTGGGMILTMTPLKGMTETCLKFIEAEEDEFWYIQAGWDDNPYLSTRDKKMLLAGVESHLVEARKSGVPALGSGRIFPIKENDLEVDPFEIPIHYKRVYALDFGWTNPTAALFAAIDPDTDIVYLYHEYYMTEKSPLEHSAALAALKVKKLPIPGVCDPKGENTGQDGTAALIEQYREHGIYLDKADNSVEAGLMAVLSAIQSGKLRVFRDRLPQFMKEIRLYRRDEKGKVVKKMDHLMDALRYLIVSGVPLARSPQNTLFKQGATRRRPNWRTV